MKIINLPYKIVVESTWDNAHNIPDMKKMFNNCNHHFNGRAKIIYDPLMQICDRRLAQEEENTLKHKS